jgi:DNA-binding transcriptional ArsR family regulator
MNYTDNKPSLLASGYFVQVHPEIVKRLGSASQAMVLQQLSYWLERSDNEYKDQTWVYNTYEDWSENLGLTPRQVRSAMKVLEEMGLVISCQPKAYDRTKWYTIDYSHVFWNGAESQMEATEMSDGSAEIVVSTNSTKNTQRELKEVSDPRIDDLCNYLADAIEKRGLRKRPPDETLLTHRWQHEMKLLLDGRVGELDTLENIGPLSPEHIKSAIDWAMNHKFWAKNILSPNSLRLKYPRLRMDAMSEKAPTISKSEQNRIDFLERNGVTMNDYLESIQGSNYANR